MPKAERVKKKESMVASSYQPIEILAKLLTKIQQDISKFLESSNLNISLEYMIRIKRNKKMQLNIFGNEVISE